jgi:CHASE2 domain-containing sensor protein
MKTRIWPFLKAGLIAAGAFMAMLIITNLPFLSLLELKGLDLLFLLRGPLPPPPEIVIVAIDEPSFAEISRQWPWPRSIHARLVDQLKKAGAKVIGFDILFAEPSEAAEDEAFARAMQAAGNVLLVSEQVVIDDPLFRQTVQINPMEPFKAVASVGHTTLQIDPDGTIRRVRLHSPDIPYFASQVVRRFLADPSSPQTAAQHPEANRRMRLDPSKEFVINHAGPPRTVKTVSYYQALQYDQMLPAGTFANKIVLVGRSFQASAEPQRMGPDVFHTPFLLSATSPTPGVEIQATIVSNLLTGQFVTEPTPAAWFGLLLLLALLGSLARFLSAWQRPLHSPPFLLPSPLGYFREGICGCPSSLVRFYSGWSMLGILWSI